MRTPNSRRPRTLSYSYNRIAAKEQMRVRKPLSRIPREARGRLEQMLIFFLTIGTARFFMLGFS